MKFFYRFLTAAVLIAVVCSSCERPSYSVKSIEGRTLTMDSVYDENQNITALQTLNIYQPQVAVIMDSVIGSSLVYLSKGVGSETLLGNFTSDALIDLSETYFDTRADMSIMNRGGLRTTFPQGQLTLGDVYKVYPFDNYLTMIYLKGKEIKSLFNLFARWNRTECLGGADVVIDNGKVTKALVAGKEIDDDKEYAIATIDYLVEGNDGMPMLNNYDSIIKSGVLLRDAMAKYIAEKSPVNAQLDGRIVIK
ncbi:MAG: 5'-nucleotidase [Bacteroidales bacterium]|nr:5'-nucleotidase [Bacteroidales bacterium]